MSWWVQQQFQGLFFASRSSGFACLLVAGLGGQLMARGFLQLWPPISLLALFSALCAGGGLPALLHCPVLPEGWWHLGAVTSDCQTAQCTSEGQCVPNSCREHVGALSTFPARQAPAAPVPELQMLVTRQPSN